MASGEPQLVSMPAGPTGHPIAPAGSAAGRSWVDALIDLIERAPGPPWVVYAVLTALSILMSNLQGWASGVVTAGQLDVALTYYGVLMIAPLWLIHLLGRIARSSLDAFWPATSLDDSTKPRWIAELSVIPARPAWTLAAFSIVFTVGSYIADPVSTRIVDLSPAGLVLRGIAESLIGAFLLILLYSMLRQLRAVSAIHATATRIDLLRPAPLYAFSRLTGATATGIVLLLYSSLLADPEAWTTGASSVFIVPWLIVPTVLAVAAFVLPLRGMQQRIATERRRLQDECARRIEGVTAAIHAAVDGDDLTRADGLNKMLASLIAERDLLGHLPTWPWQPGTVGAFATAILLPIGLVLAKAVLDRFV